MIANPEHPDFATLNDLADGHLGRDAADAVRKHLRDCPACSSDFDSLQAVLASAAILPKSVLPPDDIWPDLRRSLNSRKELMLPTAGSVEYVRTRGPTRPRTSVRFKALLGIAAVLLVVASSAVTVLVLRRSDVGVVLNPSGAAVQDVPAARAPVVLPASFAQTEAEYQRTIDELRLAVDTQRSQLRPETIRTVDRSLGVIDSAIVEARAALLADPNNRMLIDLLSANYQRKLELLRRTSELGSRI